MPLATDTRFYRGFKYIEPAIDRVGYYVWPGGIVPAEGGARASNALPPEIRNVISYGVLFCAAVPNLFLRVVGKRIPIAQYQSNLYDGGIAAYFGSPALPQIGAGYFAGYMRDFDMETAKRWADETGSGVLLGRRYMGTALQNQGHVAILLPHYSDGENYVLQSNYGDGLNYDYTIEQSHGGGYYTIMVPPWDWINYKGDEVR